MKLIGRITAVALLATATLTLITATPGSATTHGGGYHPLSPDRIVDTRLLPEESALSWAFGPGQTRSFAPGGWGGIPTTGVSAIAVNVTVLSGTAASHLTLWPTGVSRPTASNLNWANGQTIANMAIVKIGSNGQISLFNNAGYVHVLIDVVGYYDDGTQATSDRFVGLTPTRILNTLDGTGGYATTWGAGMTGQVSVTEVGGVPAGAHSVVLNFTVTGATTNSHLTAWAYGQSMPTDTSNVNFNAGQTIAALAIVKVGTDGKINVYNNTGSVHVIADVVGYYSNDVTSGGWLNPIAPTRVVDSRFNIGGYNTPWGPGTQQQQDQIREVTIGGTTNVPTTAKSVVANVTVTGATNTSHLTIWPSGQSQPFASTLNFSAGQTIANLSMLRLGTGGKVKVYNNSGAVHVIIDVVAWYD